MGSDSTAMVGTFRVSSFQIHHALEVCVCVCVCMCVCVYVRLLSLAYKQEKVRDDYIVVELYQKNPQ